MKNIFNRKSVFVKSLSVWSAFAVIITTSAPAFAAGTAVLGGDAVLTGATGATLNTGTATDAYAQFVSSGGSSAVLDWSAFNIGAGKEMNFSGVGTTFFNLVDASASKSQIDGIISGNGSVWVINPNGIAFGANSSVNVGGLFAAAAGNISNADALRDGTATMPSFSSFGGSVDVSDGAKFTAAQAALMGKTVTANGDFSGVKDLTIGAAGEMVVDEVEGGKVSVNLNEFVEKSETELDLGSLLIEGNLRAVTDGKLNVNGDVVAGSAYLKAGGEIIANKDITANVGNLQLITQDGDITVNEDANLVAHGDNALLQVQAGQNAMSLDESYNIVYSTGNIKVDGDLQVDGANGTVSVFGGYNGLGDVEINGSIKSSGDVRVITENGRISVSKDAQVKSTGDEANVRIYTGLTEYNFGGDIDIAGDVEATGESAQIDIEAAYNYFTDGSVNVSGTVVANGNGGMVTLSSGNGYSITPGNTKVSGEVDADIVSLVAYDKDVVIEDGATVKAGTFASLTGLEGVKSEGTIDVRDGVISANGNDGEVSISGGIKGTVSARGTSVSIESDNGLTVDNIKATEGDALLLTYFGNIDVKGSVEAEQSAILSTGVGNVNVHNGAQVVAYGIDGVSVGAGMITGGQGDVVVDGKVLSYGDLTLQGGSGAGSEGSVIVNSEAMGLGTVAAIGSKHDGDAVNIKGILQGTGYVYLQSTDGDITVENGGMVASLGAGTKVNVVTAMNSGADGDVNVKGTVAAVQSEGDVAAAKGVSIISGYGEGASGDIHVSGDVQSDGVSELKAGLDGNSGGSISVSGRIIGNGGVVVQTMKADADVSVGAVIASSAGNVSVVAGRNSQIDGTVSAANGTATIGALSGYLNLGEDSKVVGKNGVLIGATGSVIGQGSINAGSSMLQMESANGNLVVGGDKGVIRAGAADLSAKHSIIADNFLNDFTDVVTARGETVEIHDMNDLALGNIVADGGVYNVDGKIEQLGVIASAGGNLTVVEGAKVETKENGAAIALTSMAGDVIVRGDAVADGMGSAVSLTAGGMPGAQGADVIVDGNVIALGECSDVEISGGIAEGSSGDVLINGSVSASGKLYAYTGTDGGDIKVNGKMEVKGDNSKMALTAGWGDNTSDSSIVVAGNINAEGDDTGILLITGKASGTKGIIDVSGNITAKGDSTEIILNAAHSVEAEGDIKISGNVGVSGEEAKAWAWAGSGQGTKGNVHLQDGGVVSAEGKASQIILNAGSGKDASGNVTVDGQIDLSGSGSDLQIVSGQGDGAKGDSLINGDVKVMGDDSVADIWSGLGFGAIGSVSISQYANLMHTGNNAKMQIVAASGEKSSGDVSISGSVQVGGEGSGLRIYGGYGVDAAGSVHLDQGGKISADKEVLVSTGYGVRSHGALTIAGTMEATGKDGVASAVGGFGEGASGDISVRGVVIGVKDAQLRTGNGNINIEGRVVSSGDALVLASGKNAGNIHFGANGRVNASQTVNIISDGNVTHNGPIVQANKQGYVEPVSVNPAISAETIVLGVDGSVGSGNSYLGIEGKVYGVIGGNASIAAAGNFKGGDSATAPTSQTIANIESSVATVDKSGMVKEDEVIIQGISKDFSALGGTASLMTKGNLSIYTSGRLDANGLLKAGGDVTVSAASFGDMSYLQAGGKLTINNVGHPSHPQIAYFESVNGVEPNINNLPNDMVIFIDGRLAGGNLNILNKFGANEAFMVETPELKSTQGIFGNPPFLHSDLDVANPMAVSAVDYLIQEVPRLTLSSDFPAEVDQNVEAVGLSQKDVYWFGQKGSDEKKASDEAAEKTAETDKGSEKPSDKTVALVR